MSGRLTRPGASLRFHIILACLGIALPSVVRWPSQDTFVTAGLWTELSVAG